MKLTIDDLVEHSFCISCNNADYANFTEDFKKKLGVDKAPRMFRGFVFNVGFYPALGVYSCNARRRLEIGCGLAHYYAVKAARHLNWPYLFMFEDDYSFNLGIRDNLERVLGTIPDEANLIRYDLLRARFGEMYRYKDTCTGTSHRESRVLPQSFAGNAEGWGTQFYFLPAREYDRHIHEIERFTYVADWAPMQDIAGSPKYVFRPTVALGNSTSFRGSSARHGVRTDDKIDRKITASDHHILTEKELAFSVNNSLLGIEERGTQGGRHIKTYAAQTYIGVLGSVKIAETMGWESVTYETPRGSYTVEAKDYLKVQAVPDFNLQDVSQVDGVKFETTSPVQTLDLPDCTSYRDTQALKEVLSNIRECKIA